MNYSNYIERKQPYPANQRDSRNPLQRPRRKAHWIPHAQELPRLLKAGSPNWTRSSLGDFRSLGQIDRSPGCNSPIQTFNSIKDQIKMNISAKATDYKSPRLVSFECSNSFLKRYDDEGILIIQAGYSETISMMSKGDDENPIVINGSSKRWYGSRACLGDHKRIHGRDKLQAARTAYALQTTVSRSIWLPVTGIFKTLTHWNPRYPVVIASFVMVKRLNATLFKSYQSLKVWGAITA